ncbi:MAG: hypothetical protein ACJ8DE_11660 [Microvirga sp.]|jgi:hypothetical protein
MSKEQIAVLLSRLEGLSPEAEAEIVRSIVDIANRHQGVYRLSPEERAAIEEGLAQAERGAFVSDEDMAAFFERHSA